MIRGHMLEKLFQVITGSIFIYIVGWFSNRGHSGHQVPRIVSILCAKKQPVLKVSGLLTQWLAIGYFIGATYVILKKREDLIAVSGLFGVLLSLVILGLIFLFWIITKRFRP
jgi:hypothetical protein